MTPAVRASETGGAVAFADPADVVLELLGVTKVYPGDPPTRALEGVDLVIRRGELAAVVGPSGSGKSTLLHIVGTLERPSAGTVRVAGWDTAHLSDPQLSALRARAIGFVFQQFFLLDGETALDNVADGLLYRGLPLSERRAKAADTLSRVGLAHRLGHHPNHLSGGERQRVAIARALVGDPTMVLADEPTGNLDSRSSAAIMALLHELHAHGATIVVITHERDIAAGFPRQIAMRDGHIEHDSGVVAAPRSRDALVTDGR